MNDEESFRLSNLENLDRLDISPYERALDYQNALKLYYHGSQTKMAERLNKSESFISRYMTLAQLKPQIPNAYVNWSDLRLTHGPKLLELTGSKASTKTVNKVLQAATELHAINLQNAVAGKKPMTGKQVFDALVAAASANKKVGKPAGPLATFGPSDKPHVTLKSDNQHGLSITVHKNSGANVESVIKHVRSILRDHYKK
jgi:ParB family chromosome partitioning protein